MNKKTEKIVCIIAIIYSLQMIVQFLYMFFGCSYFYYYSGGFDGFTIQSSIVYGINFIFIGGIINAIRKQSKCSHNIL